MGTITRSFANNLTTSGVLLPASLNNNSIANVTAYNASVATGGMVLLSSQTASSSASISFTLSATYKEYQIIGVNLHPQTDNVAWQFNFSTDSGSNYNVSKTTTSFRATHNEADGNEALEYVDNDLANGTGEQPLVTGGTSADNDHCLGFVMNIFNPASTTYVKHFIITSNHTNDSDINNNAFIAGYANTTSALTNIRFKTSSGNIDDGTILLYGIV